jgi:hypothetical protein
MLGEMEAAATWAETSYGREDAVDAVIGCWAKLQKW